MRIKEKLHQFWLRFRVSLSHLFRLRWSRISLWEIKKAVSKIPEFEVKAHLYITGKTGSGKSTLTLMWVYWQWWKSRKKRDRNILVIDPHGSMVELLRKTKLAKRYADQLVYIDPVLSKNHTPTINPLECRENNPADIEIKANQLVIAIQELIPDAKLSNYMKVILKPCLFVLLSKRTATLEDLQEFLGGDNLFRLEQGKKSKVKAYRDFFRTEFMNPIYLRTKQSIYTKIQSLLNSQVFYDFTIGVSTIDLAREVRQGKVILFNLSKGKLSEEVSETIGRFIIAQLKSIVLSRAKLPPHLRKPMYLIIDEVDAFCKGDTLNIILKETRKMGLHLRVISQNIVSGKGYEKLKRNLINNTNVKIIGANGLATLKALSNETGIPARELQELDFHNFWIKYGAKRKFKVKSKDVFWKNSPLLQSTGSVISQTHSIIHDSGFYKPKLEHPIGPDDWIEDMPQNRQETFHAEHYPKPRY